METENQTMSWGNTSKDSSEPKAKPKRGRPSISKNGPMSGAERQRRSAAQKTETLVAMLDLLVTTINKHGFSKDVAHSIEKSMREYQAERDKVSRAVEALKKHKDSYVKLFEYLDTIEKESVRFRFD